MSTPLRVATYSRRCSTALKFFDGVADRFDGGSGEASGADRGEHVLNVVLALERNAAEGHHGFRRGVRLRRG